MNKTLLEVLEIIKKYNLNVLENSLVWNESGIDFQVVFAEDVRGNEWVLRFPRREDVMLATGNEKKILDFVNTHISFQAPKWEIYEQDLIAYKKLDGVPMGTINHEIQGYEYELDINNIPPIFYDSLAKTLVDLHGISLENASIAGFEVLTATEIKTNMKRRMETVKSEFGVSTELWDRWQNWLNQDDMWPQKTAFIHGEVHPGHILIKENAEVTGLIDWTESKVSDISNDFLVIYMILGDAGLDMLISAYKCAGGYVWAKMKEHIIELAATTAIPTAEFALKSGLDEYVQITRQMLGVG